MVIDAFLACLFNVHYLIFLSMVYEYAYFYEYMLKSIYCITPFIKTGPLYQLDYLCQNNLVSNNYRRCHHSIMH